MNEVTIWMKDGQVHTVKRVYQVEITPVTTSVFISGNVEPFSLPTEKVGKMDIYQEVG